MIVSVAVVPSAPLLLPGYADRAGSGSSLREASLAALRVSLAAADRVVAVSASDREPRHTGSPLGRRVLDELLPGAGWTGPVEHEVVPWDAPAEACRGVAGVASGGRVALVVAADGCARRSVKAPGHFDERSYAVDDTVLVALGGDPALAGTPSPSGPGVGLTDVARGGGRIDPSALLALDAGVCAALLCHGRAPLQVLAATLEGERAAYRVISLLAGDPFGVRYLVGSWTADA